MRTANSHSPAVPRRNSLELFDFGAKSNAAISVRLVADMHNSRVAAHFLGGISRHFRGHAERRFDGHAHLQRSRRRKEEPAARYVQTLSEMFGVVRGHAYHPQPQPPPKANASHLPPFCPL